MKCSRLKGLKAYLAGTMEFAPDDGVGWRKNITPFLEELGIIVLDPTDRPCRLSFATSATEELDMVKGIRSTGDFDKLASYVQEVVHQDLRMVDLSDILIVYIDASVPSVGTIDEFVTACNQRKPIFLFCKQGKKGVPIWLWGRMGKHWKDILCDDLEDVCSRLKRIAYCKDEDLGDTINMKRWFFLNDQGGEDAVRSQREDTEQAG